MNKHEWTELAKALGALRAEIESSWPPPGGYMSNQPGVEDRKLHRAAQLAAVDRAAETVATTLKSRSTRFDKQHFLDLVGVGHDRRARRPELPVFDLGVVS